MRAQAQLATALVSLSSAIATVQAANAAEWRQRSIYQVFTDRFARSDGSTTAPCDPAEGKYCGGTWRGIIEKLDYIHSMGFGAIWISPVTQQMPELTGDGAAYHGYWQQDLYSLNANFGTEQDLMDLVAALHSRDMYLMLDVVVNHFAFAGNDSVVNYSQFNPFNTTNSYHDWCLINDVVLADPLTFPNTSVLENCWLGDRIVSLPDLRTEDQAVSSQLQSWIKELVAKYGIDGLRIDTAQNVDPSFFPDFISSAGVFATGEIMDSDAARACAFQSSIGSILNYPLYYALTAAFSSPTGSIGGLVQSMTNISASCRDATALGVFSESHDVGRFASATDDMSLAKNLMAFTFLHAGIPIVYQGQEQHFQGNTTHNANRGALWLNGYDQSAELYGFTGVLNQIRRFAIQADDAFPTTQEDLLYQDLHTLVLQRGQLLLILTNNGVNSAAWTLAAPLKTPIASANYTELLTCSTAIADQKGTLSIPMANGMPRIYYPDALLSGSGFCGHAASSNPSTTAVSSPSSSARTTAPVSEPRVNPTTSTTHVSGTAAAATHVTPTGDSAAPGTAATVAAAAAAAALQEEASSGIAGLRSSTGSTSTTITTNHTAAGVAATPTADADSGANRAAGRTSWRGAGGDARAPIGVEAVGLGVAVSALVWLLA